ncbi:MAG: hypothetical protein WCF12_02015 [Propionicimonas sp.]
MESTPRRGPSLVIAGLSCALLVAGCTTSGAKEEASPSPSPSCTWSGDRASVRGEGDTAVTAPTVYRDGTVEFLNNQGTGYTVSPNGEVTWITYDTKGGKVKFHRTVLEPTDPVAMEKTAKAAEYRILSQQCVEG